uniref:Uncharacterized protein n=1 Tax=Daucus carota subsp. sativus TaxID=79200 RepID=A0A166CSD8_DAUCS
MRSQHHHHCRFDASGDGENVAALWRDELKNLRIKELKEIVQGRGVSTGGGGRRGLGLEMRERGGADLVLRQWWPGLLVRGGGHDCDDGRR